MKRKRKRREREETSNIERWAGLRRT